MRILLIFLGLLFTLHIFADGGSVAVIIEKKGLKEVFHPNGKIKFRYFVKKDKNGKFVIDGIKQIFYPSGQLRGRERYVFGKPDGTWVYYYDTGEQYNEIHFDHGKKVKTWTRWNKDKSIIDKVTFTYKGDVQYVKQEIYSKDGKVAKIIKYKNGKVISQKKKKGESA